MSGDRLWETPSSTGGVCHLRVIEDNAYENITFIEENKILYKRKDYTEERMTELTTEILNWINTKLNSTYTLRIPENIMELVWKNTRNSKKIA